MKKLVLSVAVSLGCIAASAQLSVNPAGGVIIGTKAETSAANKAKALTVVPDSTGVARVNFGAPGVNTPVYVGTPKDKRVLQLNGFNGFKITYGRFESTAVEYDYPTSSNGLPVGFRDFISFNVPVLIKEYYTPVIIGGELSTGDGQAMQAKGVATGLTDGLMKLETQVGAVTAESAGGKMAAAQKQAGEVYGISYESMKEQFPSLAAEGADGRQAVNYVGLVPVLVQVIQELSAEIETLKYGEGLRALAATAGAGDAAADVARPVLGQNVPNPFNVVTRIPYSIPGDFGSASICIYNLQGTQIASYGLHEKQGAVEVPAETLVPGMYLYTLIVDNTDCGTRRLIVTE